MDAHLTNRNRGNCADRSPLGRFVLDGLLWLFAAAQLGFAACSDNKSTTNPVQGFAGAGAAVSGTGGLAGTGATPGIGTGLAGTGALAGRGGVAAGASGTSGRGAAGGGASGTGAAGTGTAGSGVVGTGAEFPVAGSGGTGGSPAAGTAGGSTAAAGVGGGAAGAGGGGAASGACTRDLLKSTVDAYFTALAAHDASTLPLGANVKFTENGESGEIGKAGLWPNAGMVKFKQSLYDTKLCMSVTESVVPDGSTDIPFGLRLKVDAGKITEVETIAVRSGDYFVASNTRNMLTLADMPWETVVPAADRASREELEKWMDKYFRMFPMGGCNFSDNCRRMENGLSLECTAAVSCSSGDPSGRAVMEPRLILVDEEASLAAGFVIFIGGYTDFHMIKQVAGEVLGVHAVLGSAPSSGWD